MSARLDTTVADAYELEQLERQAELEAHRAGTATVYAPSETIMDTDYFYGNDPKRADHPADRDGFTEGVSAELAETCARVIRDARRELGHDLGFDTPGAGLVDLLLDNVPDLAGVADAQRVLFHLEEA